MSLPTTADRPSGGLRFRLAGFAVHVPWNALLGIGIIAVLWFPEFTSAATPLGQAGMAAAFAVLLMLSVLVHELAHAVIARRFGYEVLGVTLWVMGGFTTFRTGRGHGPGREAAIAAAGPAATLAVAGVSWAAATSTSPGVARDLLIALTSANLLVGLFNLLPGSPLDGGAIVKAAVWALTGSQERGQVVAGWIGRLLALTVIASPFLLSAAAGTSPSLPLVAIGLILGLVLWSGATATLAAADTQRRLRSVRAAQLARPVVALPASATVADALGRLVEPHLVVVLDEAGAPAGVVSRQAAEAVPLQARDSAAAMTACVSIPRFVAVASDADAAEVADAARSSGSRYVFLTGPDANGRLSVLGLIDVTEALAVEQS